MPNTSFFKFLSRIFILFLFLFAKEAISFGANLYSYKTGDWNNVDTWTTDPGGTTLVGSQIPANGDIVVILSSRIVSLPANVSTTGLDITINSGGTLNMSAYQFTNTLSALRGSGTLQLATTNFPAATTNSFVSTGGGTTEYNNNAGFTLPSSQGTYNNLIINLTNSSLVTTQLSNIILNGNLQVIKGVYQINDGSNARRQLTIAGNVTINSSSSMLVGTGNTTTAPSPLGISGGTAPYVNYYDQNTHRVVISGDFINNGTVRFTNQSYPEYTSFPITGAATVYFTGASDNSLTCNNNTDFYNLVIDKGTDQSYSLSVNSAGYNYFRIFGANISGGENAGDNPIIKKALWIRNGTLRLYGLVVIPSLTEGTCDGGLSGGPNSDYFIGSNAALVIDGPDVVVLTTADDYREINAAYGTTATSDAQVGVSKGGCSSFSVYGTFRIDDGYVSTRESGGFIYWATSAAQFIVNGGTLDAKQFRTANSSGGLTAYRQTGGTFTLRGRFQRTVSGVTTVASLKSVPLNTARPTPNNGVNGAVGTFNVDQDANLFEMSGGTIEILDVCGIDGSSIGRAFEVNSMPSYVNVTGGNVVIKPTTGTGATDYSYYVVSAAPFGNLTVDQASGTQTVQLTNITKAGVTARNPALNIISNLTLTGTNATLISNNYNVETGGNFVLSAGTTYTPGTNNTIFDGSGSQTFTGNGTITSGFYKFTIDKPSGTISMAGTPTGYTVRDSLQIFRGTMDDGGKTIHVKGNVFIAGFHTGTGRIVLDGTANQKVDFGFSGTPLLGTLELNNTNGATLNNNGTVDKFIFTDGMMNIGQYKLTIASGIVTGFNGTHYFQTNGIASNGGLRLAVNAASLTTGNDLTFPIGVAGNYTPCTITGNTAPGSGSGYVTFIPVNSIHPAEDGGGQHLQFYWRSIATGMPSGSNVYYKCTDNDAGDWSGGINRAFVLLTGSTDWNSGGSIAGQTININGVPNSQGFISADITAGNAGAFNNVNAYYSITSGAYNSNVWSATGHTGPSCGCSPTKASDIIYIGGDAATSRNDSITVSAGFSASVITINGSYTNNGRMPTLNIQNFGGAINVDIIKGNGKFVTTLANIPNADYGDFINSSTAVFNYHGASITLGTTITSYPNLLITATSGNQVKTLPNANIVVNRDLILSTNYTGNTLLFNGTGGNLTVYGDIKMRNTSGIQLAGAASRNMTIYGDINFRYLNSNNNNSLNVNSGTATHQLKFYGDSIIMGQSTISLTNCIMTVYDAGNTVITDRTGGTGTITVNRLVINKNTPTDKVTINHPLALSGSTNSYPKALELITGVLELNNSNINLTLSSGGREFSIPQTSGLILKGNSTVNVSGSNTGISLDGLLRAENNALVSLGDGTNTDYRYIEYSGSGNAIIELADNAVMKVNSQIRRSLAQTSGVLKYRQFDNSSLSIYGQVANVSRAKLEIVNSGSEFTMQGGTLTIVRGGGTTYSDLYLRPESSSVTGGTILFGTQNVGAIQTMRLDVTLALNHLTFDGVGTANTLQLSVNPLELNGNLLINTVNSIFNTNGLDVTVKGNFTNNGTYTSGANITTMNGTTQLLNGTSSTQFNDLIIEPAVSVALSNNITVNHDLSLLSGSFTTSTYTVNIKGNLTNNAIHSGNSATGGLLLNGNSLQLIAGSGTFGRLELNNAAGARMENNISLQQDFLLTNGILNVNQYLLTLGTNSNIVGTGFGANKMIKPDGVFSNIGIRKYFSAGATSFTFPLGVTGKYTPAFLTINNIAGGSIRINVINERHPTVVDQNNVLQYYWEIESSGLSGFEGNINLNYAPSDIRGTASNYVAARLVIPPGVYWSKAAAGPSTDNVDEINNMISFQFPSGTTSIGGEYTAGSDAAIPDEVPIYTSNGDGNWDNVNIWTPVAPSGGPNGFIVIISPGDHILTNGNRRFAYRTTINGILDLGTTYGHNLGTVMGTGKLNLEGPTLPAGRFNPFFSCSGGTLEFGGNSDYTIVADRIDTLHNLFLTGSGDRVLPDKNIVICDTLRMNGPNVKNNFNRKITLFGIIQRLNATAFSSGTGPNATLVFAGTALQHIGGANGNFTGTNILNNLEINNSHGLTLQGPVELDGDLQLTAGIINTTAANKLYMLNGNTLVIPNGGSSSSYVSGPVSKRIIGGNDFIFPTGKGTRYGKTTVLGVSDGTWESEYFNSGYSSLAVTAPLTTVSSTEYWHIAGPAGKQAYVKLRWDPSSDITPLTTQGGINDIRVAEYNTGTSRWIQETTVLSGDDYNGSAQTNDKMNLDLHDYTLASVSAIKSRAGFVNTDNKCLGENLQIAFSKSAGTYAFTYNINGGSDQPVTTSSNPYTLTTTAAGRYRITGFTGGVVDTNSVLVSPVPVATLSSNDADNSFCEGALILFTAGGGSNYEFLVNGSAVQNGASTTYSTMSLSNGDGISVRVTNASGCFSTSPILTMTVYPHPVPLLTGTTAVCTGGIEIYSSDAGNSGYAWNVAGGTITAGGTATDATVTITWSTIGDQTVSVNYTNTQGCTALVAKQLPVHVYRRPETGPGYYIPNNFNQ